LRSSVISRRYIDRTALGLPRIFGNDLGDVRQIQNELLEPPQQSQPAFANYRIGRHHENVVEESVDGGLEARGFREGVPIVPTGRDSLLYDAPPCFQIVEQHLFRRLGQSEGYSRLLCA